LPFALFEDKNKDDIDLLGSGYNVITPLEEKKSAFAV